MKRFLIFVKKETLQILRDYRTMLIVILMPAVQIILFGFALSTEVNNVDVAIYAPQRGNTARRIADRIAANPYMNFKGYIKSTDEIDKKMRNGNIDIAIAIDNGIDKVEAETSPQKTVIQIFADASNPVAANTASGYVMSIINDETGGQEMPIEIETRMLYNPQLQSSYIFVPGILGFIILIICAMITSISIVREKETGTIDMLLVSPVRPIVVIGAKLVPYFVLSCVNLATILILAKYLLGVPMQGSVLLICAISLLYIVLSLAFGILVSTISKNQIMAILICAVVMIIPVIMLSGLIFPMAILICAVVMIIPVIMLSGLIFPIENIPAALQYLSCIVPARWYIEAMRKLMIEGQPFAAIIWQTAILVAMTATFLFLAIRNLNKTMR